MGRPSAGRPPTLLAAFAALLAVRLHLKLFGLGRTLRRVRRWSRAALPHPAPGHPDAVAPAVRRVTTAAAFFPGRAVCLEQSLALYHLLRRAGIAAELKVGAQAYPFAAHAWIEVDGTAIGEDPDRIRMLDPMLGI